MALAQTEVYSVNAVGFVKQTVKSGFNLCSFNWDPVGQSGVGSVPVADLFGDQLTGDIDANLADNVVLWDAAEQKYATLWKYDDGSFSGWLDANGELATNELKNGTGFWIINRHADQQVSMYGEVVDTGTSSLTMLQGFNFFGYPYSAEKNIQNTDMYADGAHGDIDANLADNIVAWDANTQSYATYWLYDDGTFNSWLDGNGDLATKDLLLGEGFWYIRRGAGAYTWSEPQPYSL